MSEFKSTPWEWEQPVPTAKPRIISRYGLPVATVHGHAISNARHIVHCVNNYDRLVEALREVTASLAWNAHGECRRLTDGPITPSNIAVEKATALLAQLDTKGEE